MPGYFEGETMTRRALFTGGALAAGGIAGAAIALPAIGFALGPVFEEEDVIWQDVGAAQRLHRRQLHAEDDHARHGVGEAGKTDRLHPQGQPALPGEKPGEFVAISTRCAHLGCPVRWVSAAAAVRLPLPRRRLRLPGQGRGRPAGAPARPVRDARRRTGRSRSARATASTRELKRFSPRDPGEPLDGLWQYLYPKRFTTSRAV